MTVLPEPAFEDVSRHEKNRPADAYVTHGFHVAIRRTRCLTSTQHSVDLEATRSLYLNARAYEHSNGWCKGPVLEAIDGLSRGYPLRSI